MSIARTISAGLVTEVPCLECEHGTYVRHCVTENEDSWIVLTCPQCSDWEYYDRYIERRTLVMQAVGIDHVQWKECKTSGLQYMVKRAFPVETYWDTVVTRMYRYKDDVLKLRELVVEASMDNLIGLDACIVQAWSARMCLTTLERWIDNEQQ